MELSDFGQQLALGIIFDLSVQHEPDSQRQIDVVKASCVDFLTSLKAEAYTFVPYSESVVVNREQGSSVAAISNYQQPPGFFLDIAFKDTVAALGTEDLDIKKFVVFITNRCVERDRHRIQKGINVNEVNHIGCVFVLIGIGENYDRKVLRAFSEEATVLHLDYSFDLPAALWEHVRG